MGPYDIAVVVEGRLCIYHQVWAGNEEDAVSAIRGLYEGTNIIGIIFAASDKC